MAKKQKFNPAEAAVRREYLQGNDSVKVGARKSENKGFTDLPLFVVKNQTELF